MDPTRSKGSRTLNDPRIAAIPDVHGHAKGEHRPFNEERPIAYSPRMLFLWFYHTCRKGSPRFLMVSDHINYLTFEDPGAVNTVRRALKLAHAGDLYGAAETAGVDVAHAAVVSEGLRRGMRYSIGAEVDNDPRARPDAQNIVDAMRPDGIIRSVHFLTIDHPEKGAEYAWNFDNAEFVSLYDHVGAERTWELYVARLVEDIEKLPGHVVGHFYAPAKFGHWPAPEKLEEYENRMLDAALARGMAVEISTRPLYRDESAENRERYVEANKRLMRKAKDRGVGIAIGSDAHSPKDQGAGFDVVLQMLDECEINEIVFPVGGRLARVALRATREHIEAQAQQKVEPAQPGSSISGLSRAELGLPEEPEPKPEERRSKATRDAGPKKRTGGPARTGDTAAPSEDSSEPKSSPKRSAESRASSARAKNAKVKTAETPPAEAASAAAEEPAGAKPPKKGSKRAASASEPPAAAEPAAGATSAKKGAVARASAKLPAKAAANKAPAAKASGKAVAGTAPAAKASAPKAPAPKLVPKTTSAKTGSGKATAAKPAPAKATASKATASRAAASKATAPKTPAKAAAAKAVPAKAAPAKAAAGKAAPPSKKAATPIKPAAKKAAAPAKRVAAAKAAKPAVKKAAAKKSPAASTATKRNAVKKKAAAKPAAKKAAPQKHAVSRPAKKKAAKPAAKGTTAKKKTTTRRR